MGIDEATRVLAEMGLAFGHGQEGWRLRNAEGNARYTEYVDWRIRTGPVCLDGNYTAEQLLALATWMAYWR